MEKRLTPVKAIRAKCLDCSNQSAYEVTNCPIYHCPLYEYRFGHNPARKGLGGYFGRNNIEDEEILTEDISEEKSEVESVSENK